MMQSFLRLGTPHPVGGAQ